MKRFHRMEIDCGLFDIGKEDNYPLWDFLRVYIFNTYIKQHGDIQIPRAKSSKKQRLKYAQNEALFCLKSVWDCIKMLFYRGRILIYEKAKEVDEDALYYNHITRQLIESLPSRDRIVINCDNTKPTRFHDLNINVLKLLSVSSLWAKPLSHNDFNIIKNAVNQYFDITLSYNPINKFFVNNKIHIKIYLFVFKLLKPTKVVVAGDIRKYIFYAAKLYNIETFELQHAGIVFEYPSYSYPDEVKSEWNIAFADNYLQFGPAWSSVNNIPAKRLTIGNDYFFPMKPKRYFEGSYIIIISNIKHAFYLKPLARELSDILKDKEIIYKLHPNEFKYSDNYRNEFKDLPNIHVVDRNYDLQSLIAYTDMVVVIYSSVCFEALNQGKKVAILKRDNYYILKDTLKDNYMVRYIEKASEIVDFCNISLSVDYKSQYYTHFNNTLGFDIFNC